MSDATTPLVEAVTASLGPDEASPWTGSATVVLKLGSSVLRSEADLPTAVHAIYAAVRRGRRVVAVASAFAGTTERLLAERTILDPRALAAHLATGEARSVELLGEALARAGVPAHVTDVRTVGLRTTGDVLDATPTSLDVAAVRRLLASRPVLVLPGFVGHDGRGTTLLGRGGSDLTAVFVAGELGAEECVLYKDVDGLYDRDPARHGARAMRFSEVDYATALAHAGQVAQAKAVKWARDRGLAFRIAKLGADAGTVVHAGRNRVAPAADVRPLRVALLGLGTVGGGVCQRLLALEDLFHVVRVVVADCRKPRTDAPASLLTTRLEDAANGVDVIVDATADVRSVGDLLERALVAGVDVVTANKAVLAARLGRLAAARECGRARLLDSAAVGGAVPMLAAARALAARDQVVAVDAVLNGTANFVLDRVATGTDFASAVAAARAAGLAEPDASDDLDGTDAARKLVLLARAAFGESLPLSAVARADVRHLDPTALVRAAAAGAAIRAVACLRRRAGRLTAEVVPRLLRAGHPLFDAHGAQNRIVLRTASGETHVGDGLGAGRWPTTEAVLGDLLELRATRWRDR
jgi:homoserine dehydrogenase